MTKFVQTGFPQNRTCIAQRLKEKEDDDVNQEIDEIDLANDRETFVIEGREGTFVEPVSIHERYALRPNVEILNNINLAQFAISYVPISAKEVNEQVFEEDLDYSNMVGPLTSHVTGEELPKFIRLKDGSLMRLRTTQMILRIHSSKNKSNPHERMYAELLLFIPWRDERKLFAEDEEKCRDLFMSCQHEIEKARKKIYPFSKASDVLKKLMENTDDQRPSHIADNIGLDPCGEQDNLECEDEMPPLDTTKLPDEVDNHHSNTNQATSFQEATKAKPIDTGNKEDRIAESRSLSFEQKYVLNRYVHYLKLVVIAKKGNGPYPEPPHIIVTGELIFKFIISYVVSNIFVNVKGGGGVGKSFLMKLISKWAEIILRESGDHPEHPKCLLLAPTGVAAALIGNKNSLTLIK